MNRSSTATREQFQGVVIGLAVGDAIGAKWEGLLPDLIYDMGPSERIVEHASGETIYYTDDTQMTISIVQELIERGGIDKHSLARRFAGNYHPDRGYGQGARKIINAIGAGEDWELLTAEIFNGQGSLGNGAAMRVAPLGLYFCDDVEKLIHQAELSALPTHVHPIGIDSARLMAMAAKLAADGAGHAFKRRRFLESLRDVVQTEEFQWQIDHALQLSPYESLIAFGNSLEAHRSVMTSIMCFVDCPDDYAGAISRAIGQGDDVDTLAAMAGALVGARIGIDGIPTHLVNCLEDNFQGRSYLLQIANELCDRCEI